MPDIRDIVGQTSALEKMPRIDQKNQELRTEKQSIAQLDQNIIQQEKISGSKEIVEKNIRDEQEREKYERQKGEKRKVQAKKEEHKHEVKELKSSDVIEIDEGKIIDVKV